jgi:hypothetical protein
MNTRRPSSCPEHVRNPQKLRTWGTPRDPVVRTLVSLVRAWLNIRQSDPYLTLIRASVNIKLPECARHRSIRALVNVKLPECARHRSLRALVNVKLPECARHRSLRALVNVKLPECARHRSLRALVNVKLPECARHMSLCASA